MHEPLFSIPGTLPLPQTVHAPEGSPHKFTGALEEMSVTLNTAFVRSLLPPAERNLAAELDMISKTPAYKAITSATQQLAQSQNISELEAAEQLICTFRKMDELWQSYLLQEGMARVTN
jgi:hypothetical protein